MRHLYRCLRMLFLIPIVVCFGLVLICISIIYSPPRFIIHLISKVYPDVLFHIDLPSNLPYIALTIDDFPNVDDLSISFQLLDLLRTYNARCTFFTIGSNVEKYKDSSRIETLFKRLIADGHEVGNHGWRDEKAIRLSQEELEQQIINTQKIIDNYTISNNKWFRPGSGFFNRTMIQICTNLGYQIVLGSVYPHDPQIPNARLNSFFIEHKLYPGAIIILHDRLATIETLERVLPAIQRREFHLVSLTQLMKLKLNQ
jgi:peptidoglycan/xylan/chitin deacetylase (PgdA/CDA1 family)